MINKLLSIFVILVIVHILLIFKAPQIATIIEDVLGINGFTEFIVGSKSSYEDAITKLPTANEITDGYSGAYSGAIKLKDNVIGGAEFTKDKIDSFRGIMSGAEDTYIKIKDGIDSAKEFIDTASGTINETRELIDNVSKISETISSTGETATGILINN